VRACDCGRARVCDRLPKEMSSKCIPSTQVTPPQRKKCSKNKRIRIVIPKNKKELWAKMCGFPPPDEKRNFTYAITKALKSCGVDLPGWKELHAFGFKHFKDTSPNGYLDFLQQHLVSNDAEANTHNNPEDLERKVDMIETLIQLRNQKRTQPFVRSQRYFSERPASPPPKTAKTKKKNTTGR